MKRLNERDNNSWISISDLMAAVLAIFIVFYIFQIIIINKEREKYYKIIQVLDTTKFSIIENLSKNKELNININEKTGIISLNSEILFETNDYKLKKEGKEILKNFIPKYMKILIEDEKIKKYLENIVIEGHTDKNGSYLYNLKLSQQRALAVAEYINGEEIGNFAGKSEMKKYLTVNGRSYMDYLGDDSKSRRVEFKFVLKETEALEKLKNVFNERSLK